MSYMNLNIGICAMLSIFSHFYKTLSQILVFVCYYQFTSKSINLPADRPAHLFFWMIKILFESLSESLLN